MQQPTQLTLQDVVARFTELKQQRELIILNLEILDRQILDVEKAFERFVSESKDAEIKSLRAEKDKKEIPENK